MRWRTEFTTQSNLNACSWATRRWSVEGPLTCTRLVATANGNWVFLPSFGKQDAEEAVRWFCWQCVHHKLKGNPHANLLLSQGKPLTTHSTVQLHSSTTRHRLAIHSWVGCFGECLLSVHRFRKCSLQDWGTLRSVSAGSQVIAKEFYKRSWHSCRFSFDQGCWDQISLVLHLKSLLWSCIILFLQVPNECHKLVSIVTNILTNCCSKTVKGKQLSVRSSEVRNGYFRKWPLLHVQRFFIISFRSFLSLAPQIFLCVTSPRCAALLIRGLAISISNSSFNLINVLVSEMSESQFLNSIRKDRQTGRQTDKRKNNRLRNERRQKDPRNSIEGCECHFPKVCSV